MKNGKMKPALLSLCAALLIGTAMPAAAAPIPESKEPLEISADGSLEWHRNENKYIANGSAVAKQGDTIIKARVLTAHYREPKTGGMEIWKIIAEDNVEIEAPNGKAYGDHAVYNLDNAKAIMKGNALRMVSDEQSLSAKERFEYYMNQNKLVAVGDAVIIRPTETLKSDTMTAWFKEGKTNSRELWKAEAEGNVLIKTAEESIEGKRGEYRKEDNKAEVTGDVVIRRGPNILEGDRAELDLLTNVSKIFGGKTSAQGDTRVRGTFFPGSEKKQ